MSFTPAKSLQVECDKEGEINQDFAGLSQGVEILLRQIDIYPFSRKYGWVNDQYGVLWQLML